MQHVQSDPFVGRLRSALERYDGDAPQAPRPPDDEAACSDFARATPVYFIGDSQSLVFRDRVYRLDAESTRYVVARSKYCPGLCASNFTDERNALNPAVITALRSEHLIVVDERDEPIAYHRTPDRHWRGVAAIEGRARSSPTVVFMCGSLDGVQIFHELGVDADFTMPGHTARAAEPGAARRLIPFAEVKALVERHLRPYERGLRLLQSWGLDRIFVHAVVPPQHDDDTFAEQFAIRVPFEVRTKLFALLNDSLARISARSGCSFVDTSEYTEQSGALRAEFIHDSFHFNQRAALLTVNAVMRELSVLRGRP